MCVCVSAHRVLWRPVDLGPVDGGTFDLEESVEELLEAIKVFSRDLEQNEAETKDVTLTSDL